MPHDPTTATSPTSSMERVIDGLQTAIARSAGSGRTQADGADPQIVDGQHDWPAIEEPVVRQPLLSRVSDQLHDALQILKREPPIGTGYVEPISFTRDEHAAIERRLFNAIELLRASAR